MHIYADIMIGTQYLQGMRPQSTPQIKLASHLLDRKTYHRKSMHVEEMSGDTRCVREVYWLFSNPEENTREKAKQPKHKRHPPQTNPETKTSQ